MLFPFIYQFDNPQGFWVHANKSSFCKRFGGAYRGDAPTICGPSDINGAASVVVTPAASSPRVRAISRTCPPASPLVLASSFSSASVAKSTPVGRLQETGQAASALQLPSVHSSVKSSNLDLTGAKLVKRGALVSWHGMRFTVSKVRLGTCYPRYPSTFGPPAYLKCGSVQVVV